MCSKFIHFFTYPIQGNIAKITWKKPLTMGIGRYGWNSSCLQNMLFYESRRKIESTHAPVQSAFLGAVCNSDHGGPNYDKYFYYCKGSEHTWKHNPSVDAWPSQGFQNWIACRNAVWHCSSPPQEASAWTKPHSLWNSSRECCPLCSPSWILWRATGSGLSSLSR